VEVKIKDTYKKKTGNSDRAREGRGTKDRVTAGTEYNFLRTPLPAADKWGNTGH